MISSLKSQSRNYRLEGGSKVRCGGSVTGGDQVIKQETLREIGDQISLSARNDRAQHILEFRNMRNPAGTEIKTDIPGLKSLRGFPTPGMMSGVSNAFDATGITEDGQEVSISRWAEFRQEGLLNRTLGAVAMNVGLAMAALGVFAGGINGPIHSTGLEVADLGCQLRTEQVGATYSIHVKTPDQQIYRQEAPASVTCP